MNSDLHKGKGIAYKVMRAYSDAWREKDQENRETLFEVLLQRNVDLKGCYEWLKIIEKDCQNY